MSWTSFFIVMVTGYAIFMTVLFSIMRSAFNDLIRVIDAREKAQKKAVDEFFAEVDWLLEYTESEEVEKSVNKLKSVVERNQ